MIKIKRIIFWWVIAPIWILLISIPDAINTIIGNLIDWYHAATDYYK